MLDLRLRSRDGQDQRLALPTALSKEVLQRYHKHRSNPDRDSFRSQFCEILGDHFSSFSAFADQLDQYGVAMFRIKAPEFSQLVQAYEAAMAHAQHATIGHTFLDLRAHHQLFTNPGSLALLNPMYLALLAYRLGGPLRLTGGRAKDTPPTMTTVRDNGVHVDDSPFHDEYKILTVWPKGMTKGPSGQNFVCIAGTQKLVRLGETEHGANFKTSEEIIKLLAHPGLQPTPFVIEAADEHPLSILFEASALAHHRHRCLDSQITRSCTILAFHVDEHAGAPTGLFVVRQCRNALEEYVIGGKFAECSAEEKTQHFLSALKSCIPEIAHALRRALRDNCFIPPESKKMSHEALCRWLSNIDDTPDPAHTRSKMTELPSRREDFAGLLLDISDRDKHFDLDLRMYPDRRELLRVSVRNRIRERGIKDVLKRSYTMRRFLNLDQPSETRLLRIEELARHGESSCEIVDRWTMTALNGLPDDIRGIRQLLGDLTEATNRTATLQQFRTNSIFLYWTLDELFELMEGTQGADQFRHDVDDLAKSVLSHYAALVWLDDQSSGRPKATGSLAKDTISQRLRAHAL